MSIQFCGVCRRFTRHAVLQGTTPAPSFDCCQMCGMGVVVEAEEVEAS